MVLVQDMAADAETAITTDRDLDEAQRWLDDVECTGERIRIPVRLSTGAGLATWRRFGQGRPLVMVHGGHGSWLHWIRNVRALSQSHEVWLPDMPGFGDSAAVLPQDMGELVQAMLAMLEQLFPTQPVDLAGFSFGGLMAANIAVRFPRVRKVALLGPAGHGTPRRQKTALVNWRLSPSTEALHAVMRGNLAAHMLANPASVDALALTAHIRSCKKVRFRSKGISRSWKLVDVLPGIQAPVLILWGEHDVTATPDLAQPELLGDRADRCGEILPHGGHWVQFELADEVNDRLQRWFGA